MGKRVGHAGMGGRLLVRRVWRQWHRFTGVAGYHVSGWEPTRLWVMEETLHAFFMNTGKNLAKDGNFS